MGVKFASAVVFGKCFGVFSLRAHATALLLGLGSFARASNAVTVSLRATEIAAWKQFSCCLLTPMLLMLVVFRNQNGNAFP